MTKEIRPSNVHRSAARDGELRVLIVEDVPTDAELCARELTRGGFVFTSKRVDTRADFEDALQTFSPDLIMSDFAIPGRSMASPRWTSRATKLRTRRPSSSPERSARSARSKR